MSVLIKNFCLCLLFVCVFSVAVSAHTSFSSVDPLFVQPAKEVVFDVSVFNQGPDDITEVFIGSPFPIKQCFSLLPFFEVFESGFSGSYYFCKYEALPGLGIVPLETKIFQVSAITSNDNNKFDFSFMTIGRSGGSFGNEFGVIVDDGRNLNVRIDSPIPGQGYFQQKITDLKVVAENVYSGVPNSGVAPFAVLIIQSRIQGSGIFYKTVALNIDYTNLNPRSRRIFHQDSWLNLDLQSHMNLQRGLFFPDANLIPDVNFLVRVFDGAGNSVTEKLPVEYNVPSTSLTAGIHGPVI